MMCSVKKLIPVWLSVTSPPRAPITPLFFSCWPLDVWRFPLLERIWDVLPVGSLSQVLVQSRKLNSEPGPRISESRQRGRAYRYALFNLCVVRQKRALSFARTGTDRLTCPTAYGLHSVAP